MSQRTPPAKEQQATPGQESRPADHIQSATVLRVGERRRPMVQTQVSTDIRAGGAQPSEPPPSQASEPLWGAGRIRILDEVGRGAMGAVLRGLDVKLQRELALKVAPVPRNQMARTLLARFIEEAQITAQLEHPNIVPVHDMGLDPQGRAYFSMKLVRGQSLEEIIEKRNAGDPQTLAEFGLRRLLDVFLQVCQAVEYVHARGVIHRDLKPANIMVGDFGEVLVMDWGIAKLVAQPEREADAALPAETTSAEGSGHFQSSRPPPIAQVTSVRAGRKAWQTQHGALIGTPAYMSPEQAQGKPVDERTDVYALGVILYEILCGQVPFDDEEPRDVIRRLLNEKPGRPSKINPTTPLALEMLALKLLEKDPERRNLSISQIRAHVQNYIEGIGRDYRRESLWTGALWSAGALGLFAFLVWYLTGQSVATVLALGPPAVLNAVGWFLLTIALGYPLSSIYEAFRHGRARFDRFEQPSSSEVFASAYLAHRTFAAAVAPLFQLIFIVELVSIGIARATRGDVGSLEIQQLSMQMRAEWAQALVVMAVFLFAYLFLLSTEVRFARKIDRYALLVDRKPWEAVWPFFLILILLLTVVTTDVVDWALTTSAPSFMTFVGEQIMTPPLNLFDMVKTLVFQTTFLLGLVVATLLLSFPFAEVLASLRIAYQPADEAAVSSRAQYFLRSMALFRVTRMIWLYGGAMIGALTAMTILSAGPGGPLVEKVLYILGPSLVGFLGYWIVRSYVHAYVSHAPAVKKMFDQELGAARREQVQANLIELERSPWRRRLFELLVPILCILGYLVWSGSGIHQQAIQQLIMPVTTKGWLLILPYALLLVVLLARDPVQRRQLRKRLERYDTLPSP